MARAICLLAGLCVVSLCAGCTDGPASIAGNGAEHEIVVIDPARGMPGTPPPGSPEEVVMDFHDGLQSGELDPKTSLPVHAMPFVASGLTHDALDRAANAERLRNICRLMANDRYDFHVLESREDGQCAIVIIQETLGAGPNQPRYFYLIQQRGLWKVLPRAVDAHGVYLTPEQLDAFVRLVEWFESAKEDGRW